MKIIQTLAALALTAAAMAGAYAHHSSQAEYGTFDSPWITVDGVITDIRWGNPHIAIDIEVTGGDLPADEIGETWTIASHPIHIMNAYGFVKEEFALGDQVHLLTWRHVRGTRNLWPRAIQINEGPLKSNLRYTDMIDIAKGTFAASGIVPAANLAGSAPQRAGPATEAKLAEMGLLDEEGNMIWPPPAN